MNNIQVLSEWEVYQISYLVSKGWKRDKSASEYHDDEGPMCWYKDGFLNKNIRYDFEEGNYKDSVYFTLDQAWRAQDDTEER